MQKTFIPKDKDIQQQCYLIDAQNKILGRLATQVANLLMGKGKVYFAKHIQCGDRVVIINAKGVKVSGRKSTTKIYAHYTGYPGGREEIVFEDLQAQHPEWIIEEAVKRMLPKNRLRAKLLKRLHIYAGAEHEQAAHKPIVLN